MVFSTEIKKFLGFPGGSVVKNPPASTRNTGSIPGLGTKIPDATGQWSMRTATTETML